MYTFKPRIPGRRLDLEQAAVHREGIADRDVVQPAFDEFGVPLFEVTFVVFDLETTGGPPGAHSITEIGAVKVRGGKVIGEFATLVNPEAPIPPSITVLTGITNAMVLPAPKMNEVLPSFVEFIGHEPNTVLVAHNARFDVGHIRGAAAALELDFPTLQVADTVQLARRVITKEEVRNYKLSTLAAVVGAEVTPSHRALDDARATVDVLHAILSRLGALGVTHLEDLATVQNKVPAHRRMKAKLADGLPRTPGIYFSSDQAMKYSTSARRTISISACARTSRLPKIAVALAKWWISRYAWMPSQQLRNSKQISSKLGRLPSSNHRLTDGQRVRRGIGSI